MIEDPVTMCYFIFGSYGLLHSLRYQSSNVAVMGWDKVGTRSDFSGAFRTFGSLKMGVWVSCICKARRSTYMYNTLSKIKVTLFTRT
jgi:hypothetical protein